MKRIKYSIKLLSPVVISASSSEMNTVDCLDYIPGSTLLGIFASKYISKKKCGYDAHKDDNFRKYFLRGGLIFSNAYLKTASREYLPTPLSIQKKKSDESILNLIEQDTDEQTTGTGQFCDIAGESVYFSLPEKNMNFHHSRKENRIAGKSSDGAIFNYAALSEGQEFKGYILGSDDNITAFLGLFPERDRIACRVGRSKKTQYGNAEILLEQSENYPENNVENGEAVVTFISPAVLLNENGYPEVSAEILLDYLTKDGLVIEKIEQIFSKAEDIETFIAKWGKKKPQAKAFSAGTTFKINIEGDTQKLKELEQKGLGERLGEGFGRIKINWVVAAGYSARSEEQQSTARPEGELPALLKVKFRDIILENIRKSVVVEALNLANSARVLPKNSLLGRLESDLKKSSSGREFKEKIQKYKETATKSLKKCRIGGNTLYKVVENELNMNVDSISSAVSFFCADVEINIEGLKSESAEMLYKLYWLTFFARLRKRNKEDKTKGGEGNE